MWSRLAVVMMLGLAVVWPPEREVEAQVAPLAPPSRFKSGADVVVANVSVEGREGGFVPGLSADEFLILDNNVPQKIAFFSTEERVPLAVVLLIDRSSSMAGTKLTAAKAAALAFLDTLQPRDLVEVMAFNEHISRLFPLSASGGASHQAIDELSASGGTGLFEAVLVGLHDLKRAERDQLTHYRYALVILSDGEDTKNLVAFDDVLEDARRSGATIYGISLRTDEREHFLAPPRELLQLAHDSGGRAIAAGKAASLVSIYQEVGGELQHLYRLGFVPSPLVRDGQWHPISVRVPGRDVNVRARSGYYAPRH